MSYESTSHSTETYTCGDSLSIWSLNSGNDKMLLAQEVVDRLLLAKGLLGGIRFAPAGDPDRTFLARAILTAHDAAELALAAIAHHLNRLPGSKQVYLMKYFDAIQEGHPDPKEHVTGRGYFSLLNRIRADLKHLGIFPDPRQWQPVGERTYDYVSGWCERYLEFSLDEFDESVLIADPKVKGWYDQAAKAFRDGQFKKTLEHLAYAAGALFKSNQALRNLGVGTARAEDAIKLAAFGVHANDYLALQEFLPSLIYDRAGSLVIDWNQRRYGHPGNWTKETVEFSLKTFVDVALRIQHANWIPGALDFFYLYEHKVTALVDSVKIVQDQRPGLLTPPQPVVVRTLRKGESLRCNVIRKDVAPFGGLVPPGQRRTLSIANLDEGLWGEVEASKVRVTCVPRDNELVRKHFPDLVEVEFEP